MASFFFFKLLLESDAVFSYSDKVVFTLLLRVMGTAELPLNLT
jgi:hypothetical protein